MVKEDEAVAAKSAPSKVGCVPLGWSDNSTQTSSFSLPQQVPEDVNGSVRSGTEVSDFPMSSLCCKAAVQDSSVTDHSDFGQPVVNKEGMGDIPQSSLPIEANCMGDLMSPNLKFSTNFAHSSPHFCSPPVSVSPSPPQGRNGLTPIVLRSPPMNTPKDNVTTRGTGVFLGGRYSQKEVIAYGGISEGGIFGVRTSERVRAQPNADETQLKRAQLIAQAKEDILYSGTIIPSKFTIASIPNDVIAARASKLGISLGDSPSNVTDSISKIKDIDLNRTLIMLKNKKRLSEQY
jgi:hypothetical protein